LVAGARSAYRVVSGGLEVEPGSVRQVFLDPPSNQGEDYGDGPEIGGGVYNLGTFTVDVFTVIAHNHASTSNDDIFP
jgi:hypothetical protein